MGHEGQERRRTALVEELRRAAGKPLSIRELMQRARIHPGERTDVKRALRDLTREGVLLRDGKRFSLPGARPAAAPAAALAPVGERRGMRRAGRGNEVVGTLKKHRDGYGFVARIDRKGDDVFVPPGEAAQALDGDLVRVEIVPARGGRTAGRLVEVIERRRRLLIGTYHARGARSFVVPADEELGEAVPVPETAAAQDGDVVKVALEPGTARLQGAVVEAIGRPGEPRVEVLKVAYAKGFADVFPEPVRAEAEATPDRVRPEDRQGRRDLTALPLVTIDGEDARDFDDAVHVERLEGRKGLYRLVVAIADVAHYVRPGAALDAEAGRRGTSVYFPMQVLPMLPERLSNGICSLNPDVDRLCMVADLVVDEHGETRSAEVYEGVMRSAARCTYTEVANVVAGQSVPGRDRFRERFLLMAELQEKLTAMRGRRGALDFDLPEAKIVLGEGGEVVAIEKRPRNRAHRIVEEFMLAANEAVARWFGSRELPTIYRIHDVPDEEKLQAFLDLAESHGFEVPEVPGPRALNALLGRFQGHAQQRALNQLLLRAMMQAVYATENIGHYGLAAQHYLHFTSPIRRYPDLVVHRLLKEEWARRQGQPVREPSPAALAEMAAVSSERERAAMEAERDIAAFYAALFMKDKVGERYEGVISAVVEFGLFVELKRWFVEGLVRLEDLGGAPELDTELHALVDRTTGRAFRVGDEVTVDVVSASPIRRRIELKLVEEAKAIGKPAAKGRRRREAEPVLAEAGPEEADARGARAPRRGKPAPASAPPAAGRRQRSGEGHREHGVKQGPRARTGGGREQQGERRGRGGEGRGRGGEGRGRGGGEGRGRGGEARGRRGEGRGRGGEARGRGGEARGRGPSERAGGAPGKVGSRRGPPGRKGGAGKGAAKPSKGAKGRGGGRRRRGR
ncbi:ribonuclease R [Anaeromyxobacter sp. Fw109-5]|uniref:ribonuclease R n=1 Tax=Anaeromyxobacter sp. (strain Fw109-5) TaxID=404589 RepID=UPI0000ED7DB2|nr:ribonuclease R [Anaeromyxobacter sp. Fw109-5]ABS25654.1 ribonuclease R [Anaeromyxobacter sp. Fw109-5]